MHAIPTPQGYPHLGLVATSMTLRWRRDANLERLTARVTKWEHDHGNPGFTIHGLGNLDPAVAFELAHVYVALRERYPHVRPERVDLQATRLGPDVLAASVVYPYVYSNLRAVTPADGSLPAGTKQDRHLRRELAYVAGTRSVHASGTLALRRSVSTSRGQQELVRCWYPLNGRKERVANGRLPLLDTTPATYLLVHEFGHLLDGELTATGWETAEPAYAALTTALLGTRHPHPRQWRRHLINYPTSLVPAHGKGPHQGDLDRQQRTRQVLREQIAAHIGWYGPTDREELWAETFAVAHCGTLPAREQFGPFLRTLHHLRPAGEGRQAER